ncbi:MAG: FUN14 domain-containing protein [Trueperaceae bacterium]
MEFADLSTVAPYLQQLTFGAAAGFLVGYALKKVGKIVALIIGLLFVAIQILAYLGFVTVNWAEVQARLDPLLEWSSLNEFWRGLIDLLTYNVTFAVAFVPALVLGLKRG